MEGKAYTFRAKPERVALLTEMGVDLALLANNHVYDYGKESILDTFDTLETEGIGYFGAGRTLADAMKPYYVEADAIIGSHSHCLQGMEFYDGKPIIYSLGNFWFNKRTLPTMLLSLHITGEREEPKLEVKVIPAIQENNTTTILTETEDIEELYQHLEDISINVEFSPDGVLLENDLE